MQGSLTLDGLNVRATLSLLSGVGMAFFSILTIDHFFAANYPESIFEGSFCDLSAFFNCDSSAYSTISAIYDVPLGYFGLVVGLLVIVGAVFPSVDFERTNKAISTLNALGVVVLLAYSVFNLGSLCLLCTGYYLFSLVSFFLFAQYGVGGERSFARTYLLPSIKHLLAFAVIASIGAYGIREYHMLKKDAQSGSVASRIVKQYYALDEVPLPSLLSPFWSVRSTENFEDAPIQIVEFGDFLCSDCLFLFQQMQILKTEFSGKINIAFQHFPLEAQCNDVVEKDKHPGACELAYIASYDSTRFGDIHDEIFENFQAAKDPAWRAALAERYGAAGATEDSATVSLVHRLIETGREYQKTSDQYAYGIRSTPTLIINGRMIIGTLPIDQLRAILQSIADEAEGRPRFIENWEDTD